MQYSIEEGFLREVTRSFMSLSLLIKIIGERTRMISRYYGHERRASWVARRSQI